MSLLLTSTSQASRFIKEKKMTLTLFAIPITKYNRYHPTFLRHCLATCASLDAALNHPAQRNLPLVDVFVYVH